jgi:hypothetical protein
MVITGAKAGPLEEHPKRARDPITPQRKIAATASRDVFNLTLLSLMA